jgi:2-haloacid dehalogenase
LPLSDALVFRPSPPPPPIASHAWDVAAARSAGYETAYCTAYEGYSYEMLYGKMDLVVPDLVSLGKGIVEKWGGK